MTPESDPYAIVTKLRSCIADLDALGAVVPAAHIDLAIEKFRIEFNLDASTSNSDQT